MFTQKQIPAENPQIKQFLTQILGVTGATADQKSVAEKKLEKVNKTIADKIANTPTISEYFDRLWKQTNPADQSFVVTKLQATQYGVKEEIVSDVQKVSKTSANLDTINEAFKMTPFEEIAYQEKVKEVRQKKKLEIENPLQTNLNEDPEFIHALNRPYNSATTKSHSGFFHYVGGLLDPEDTDEVKIQKAEGLVRKIKADRREFDEKLKQRELSADARENQRIERLLQKEQQEEQLRQKQKKEQLENHIKELKARTDVRAKESAKWEQEYKSGLAKKPMFKEIEMKYKKAYVIPELEQRKKKLQELRDFHRPMNHEELNKREQEVMKILEEEHARKKNVNENAKWNYNKPAYESRHHKIFAEETAKMRSQKEMEDADKAKRKERVNELLKDVKERHAPKVDAGKELELVEMIEKLKQKKNNVDRFNFEEEREKEDGEQLKKLGNDYMHEVKEKVKKYRDMNRTGAGDVSELRTDPSGAKMKTALSVKSDPAGGVKKKDYLSELRKENKIADATTIVDIILKKKDMDEKEKEMLLKNEVLRLEDKVKRKELLKKLKKGKIDELNEAIEDEEVDQLYVKTIKAKLEMLGGL